MSVSASTDRFECEGSTSDAPAETLTAESLSDKAENDMIAIYGKCIQYRPTPTLIQEAFKCKLL
ncbi:MAG: hypothetical protein IKT65_07500 [Clostridia bacterium]|nr:hypothetical protein [Clostridia bacterium]